MKLSELIGFLTEPEKYTITYRGHEVKYLNEACTYDDDSRFFVAGHEFGATHLIHVESRREGFEQAWGLWIDESPTIPEKELIEAYCPSHDKGSFLDEAIDAYPGRGEGRWTDEDWAKIRENARKALADADDSARNEDGEYPELVEGYEHQDNASGTGIVDVGHYAWMNEADLDDVEITLKA